VILNPLSWIRSIETYLIVGGAALVIGFGGGYEVHSKFTKAVEVTSLKRDAKVSGANVVESHKASVSIESKVALQNAVADKLKSAAALRVAKQQERAHEEFAKELARSLDKKMPPEPVVCPDPVLDVGTVRLLNAAREGAAVDAAGSSDAALETPSAVGVGKLVDNDLDVVKLYHDLAARHDALVDAVEKKLQDQAK
jgi:hypothetical protein